MAGNDEVARNFAQMLFDFSTYKSVEVVISAFEGAAENWKRHVDFFGRISKGKLVAPHWTVDDIIKVACHR